jgi:hypothetical protein
MNTDKLAATVHIMDLEAEIERLRGCWTRAKNEGDGKAMKMFDCDALA